jgi:hypothetical protein
MREPNLSRLSESDIEALKYAVENFADKTFNELKEESHKELAYVRANGGRMRYEDMLSPNDPELREKAAFLEEAARTAAL